ncbi:hypothetical protein ACHAWF_008622 [Thalassiosira exigua]
MREAKRRRIDLHGAVAADVGHHRQNEICNIQVRKRLLEDATNRLVSICAREVRLLSELRRVQRELDRTTESRKRAEHEAEELREDLLILERISDAEDEHVMEPQNDDEYIEELVDFYYNQEQEVLMLSDMYDDEPGEHTSAIGDFDDDDVGATDGREAKLQNFTKNISLHERSIDDMIRSYYNNKHLRSHGSTRQSTSKSSKKRKRRNGTNCTSTKEKLKHYTRKYKYFHTAFNKWLSKESGVTIKATVDVLRAVRVIGKRRVTATPDALENLCNAIHFRKVAGYLMGSDKGHQCIIDYLEKCRVYLTLCNQLFSFEQQLRDETEHCILEEEILITQHILDHDISTYFYWQENDREQALLDEELKERHEAEQGFLDEEIATRQHLLDNDVNTYVYWQDNDRAQALLDDELNEQAKTEQGILDEEIATRQHLLDNDVNTYFYWQDIDGEQALLDGELKERDETEQMFLEDEFVMRQHLLDNDVNTYFYWQEIDREQALLDEELMEQERIFNNDVNSYGHWYDASPLGRLEHQLNNETEQRFLEEEIAIRQHIIDHHVNTYFYWQEVDKEQALLNEKVNSYRQDASPLGLRMHRRRTATGTTLSHALGITDDIFKHFRSREIQTSVQPMYMKNQPFINENRRATLIDWLVNVQHCHQFLPETLYIAVNVIDRFLTKSLVLSNKLQLVGATALMIASKYEERHSFKMHELITVCAKVYAKEEVRPVQKWGCWYICQLLLTLPRAKVHCNGKRYPKQTRASNHVPDSILLRQNISRRRRREDFSAILLYLGQYIAELPLASFSPKRARCGISTYCKKVSGEEVMELRYRTALSIRQTNRDARGTCSSN